MAQQTRNEWWFLMTYAKLGDLQPLFEQCHHYAYCVHDKDIKEDGTDHEVHTHILIKFETKKSLDQVRTLINSDQNTFGECQRRVGNSWVQLNKTACYRYLLHLDSPEKYRYDEQERVTDDNEWWTKYADYKELFATATEDTLYEDLIAPYKSRYDYLDTMAKKYGRDFIKNLRHYDDFRNLHSYADLENQEIEETERDPNREKFLKVMHDYGYTYEDLIHLMEQNYYVKKRYEYLYKHDFKDRQPR